MLRMLRDVDRQNEVETLAADFVVKLAFVATTGEAESTAANRKAARVARMHDLAEDGIASTSERFADTGDISPV